ncbi:MAG: CCA tRNA nucleotidyltransferase [Rickettsiales bacterium]|nr:CCA tRNA nucleotidyltransferase [Rickettsiales bacterium]
MTPKIISKPNLLKKFPKQVIILFKIFGDDIRLVGGCVRDLLLQKKVNDFDFATKFLPQETIKILQENNIKALPTGIKFGTITAVIDGKNFEITTLRQDQENDGRHCKPKFIDDYFFDAARRDFTINALYLDYKGFIYDYFDGISDLKNKEVKFIGDANIRISEDYLRILRFFRFSCQYSKTLDRKGLIACVKQKSNLKKLSRPRIRAEILKMLSTTNKKNLITVLKVLKKTKIVEEIFFSQLDVKALEKLFVLEKKFKLSSDLDLKIAVLFLKKNFDLKNFYEEICATNLEKKYFYFLQNNQIKNFSEFNKLLIANSKEVVLSLYLFGLAKSSSRQKTSLTKKNIKYLQEFSLPDFPLESSDLIELKFSGKILGEVLQKAKEFWAKNNFDLTKSDLIKFVAQFSK